MVGRLIALPLWARALLGLAVLVILGLSGVLSALASLGAFLVLIVAILILGYRVLRRRTLRNWGLIAVAALVLMFVYAGIAGARLGEVPQQASSPSNSKEEEQDTSIEEDDLGEPEAKQQETPIEETEEEAKSEEIKPALDDENSDSDRFDAVATVTLVVDGDTVEISPAIDSLEEVRFIGVDTPEVNDPNCEGGKQPHGRKASKFTQDNLEGEEIELEFDKDKTDQYDRLLAYVYPKGGEMFNKKLLEEGYAQVRTFPPNEKYDPEFKKAQREAKQAERGIWSLSSLETVKLMDKAYTPGGDGCSPKTMPKVQQKQQQPTPDPDPNVPTPDIPSAPAVPAPSSGADCSTGAKDVPVVPGSKGDRDGDGIACES